MPLKRKPRKSKNSSSLVKKRPQTEEAKSVTCETDFEYLDIDKRKGIPNEQAFLRKFLFYYLDEEALDTDGLRTFFNSTRSARAAANGRGSDATHRAWGRRLVQKAGPVIKKWFDEQGISELRLKKKLFDLLYAKETKFFTYQGRVVERTDVAALNIQLKAWENAAKMMGLLKDQVQVDLVSGVNVRFDPQKLSNAALDELAAASSSEEDNADVIDAEFVDCDWEALEEGAD